MDLTLIERYQPPGEVVAAVREAALEIISPYLDIIDSVPPEDGAAYTPEERADIYRLCLNALDQYLVDAKPVNKVSGQPFTIAEIAAVIEENLS